MTGASDHAHISIIYSSTETIIYPKFIKIKSFKLLSKNTLLKFINSSSILNDIFNYVDPNMIANILQLELNSIINVIAPTRIVQFKKNYIPYINNDIKLNLITQQNLLKTAIETNDMNDWRLFKNFRNHLSKIIEKSKKSFFEENF